MNLENYISVMLLEQASYGYKGSIELRRYPEGYVIVNELPIEEYLCAVVPSEMPAAYEVEALKAQAVCARSYAYIQLERGDYAAFGAHVDDSTNYQVYNKKEGDEKTSAAVLDTAGKVIHYQGKIAEAYYFSTSSGITGNGEAWNLAADSQYGYLRNTLVKEGGLANLTCLQKKHFHNSLQTEMEQHTKRQCHITAGVHQPIIHQNRHRKK